ncbi:MAG: hypothetical protein JO097_00985 [Acidobacteriaceae bacterium]|nr:hypothetical protein [Acidobacteriaceae bacterium]MBV9295882.1 hypothetical protein [Acidobacteriaceae bacterium]MBV9764158.1 hypothetical protein [Acidobacteriaceae bacterium]
MRTVIGSGAMAFLMCGFASIAPAQKMIQPGQLASATQVAVQPTAVTPVSSSSVAPQKTNIADVQGNHGKLLNAVWITSMFAAAGASSLDAYTSWGKHESNPLLASSNGTFGTKGVVLKAGIAATVLVPQILLRKHREMKGLFASGNLGEAAIFSGVAVHNMGVRSPSPSPTSH